MIDAIEKNLERGINLLNSISDEQYSDASVAPYNSSIGSHMRHVLDVFSCIFKGLENNFVDFSVRERNLDAEQQTSVGIEYFQSIIHQLKTLKEEDFKTVVEVSDDMGLGNVIATYTVGSALMQAQSHAIHHYASIGYLVYQLEIQLPDAAFGFNPTTPNMKLQQS